MSRAVVWFALLAVVQHAGCALGGGSAFVGQWRAHERIDFEACLVDDQDRCLERKQLTTHVPERPFWGVIVTYPAVGVASVTQGSVHTIRLRLTPSLELMKGRGTLAFGVRIGAQIDGHAGGSLPVVALGHLSLTERLSIHVGAGYLPLAWAHGAGASSNPFTYSSVGAQALAGLQLALSRTHSESYVVATIEGDDTWIAFDHGYHALGLTGHLGIFF